MSVLRRFLSTCLALAHDLGIASLLAFRAKQALVAENLFLRKQLALFQERKTCPRRADDATRILMIAASRCFNWQNALVVVKADTLVRWHRKAFSLFWRWKSRPRGRPVLPQQIRELIRRMARENVTWGAERITNELKVKLGIQVSPSTVRKYMGRPPGRWRGQSAQRWSAFLRNHARAIVACDFFTVVTAQFRILYVFVAIDLERRRVLHCNVTARPTAEWTLQQLRETLPGDHAFRYLIHDNDSIFSSGLDEQVAALGVSVLRTPKRAPQANSLCERLIGTMRRECLDFLIPLGEQHLKRTLHLWVRHYNRGRVHMSLGPGIPEQRQLLAPIHPRRHPRLGRNTVQSKAVLGGLHHEYWLEKRAA